MPEVDHQPLWVVQEEDAVVGAVVQGEAETDLTLEVTGEGERLQGVEARAGDLRAGVDVVAGMTVRSRRTSA